MLFVCHQFTDAESELSTTIAHMATACARMLSHTSQFEALLCSIKVVGDALNPLPFEQGALSIRLLAPTLTSSKFKHTSLCALDVVVAQFRSVNPTAAMALMEAFPAPQNTTFRYVTSTV
jgi:hypothetical protein